MFRLPSVWYFAWQPKETKTLGYSKLMTTVALSLHCMRNPLFEATRVPFSQCHSHTARGIRRTYEPKPIWLLTISRFFLVNTSKFQMPGARESPCLSPTLMYVTVKTKVLTQILAYLKISINEKKQPSECPALWDSRQILRF